MNTSFEKKAGQSLIAFTILITFTMVLHPSGGNFKHLLQAAQIVIISHSVALISLPFAAIGFWGLTKKIGRDSFPGMAGYFIMCFGLVAVMMAGTVNGLVLPIFVQNYPDATPDTVASLKPVLNFMHALNTAFDYIYTSAICLALLFWGAAMIDTKRMPAWLAWFGIVVALGGIAITVAGVSPATLHGLRMFVLLLVVWIVAAAVNLINTEPVAQAEKSGSDN